MRLVETWLRRVRQYGWYEALAISRIELRYWIGKRRERAIRALVWRLPWQVVTWAYIRVAAHATTGRYGNTVVPDLSMMDALKRWDDAR